MGMRAIASKSGARAMLSRLLLILLQIVAGWYGANFVMPYVSIGEFQLFLFAVVAAIIVWVLGLLGSQVLRDIGQPGGGTLATTVVFALVGAALATWGPQMFPPLGATQPEYLALAGAIIGYIIKK
jgi:uncharacterized membrane protein YeaQ/YmgE (transglycosylase-associated protein family)